MKLSSLLTAVFIFLKLTNYINWSWFLVLSPTIIAVLFNTGLFLAAVYATTKE